MRYRAGVAIFLFCIILVAQGDSKKPLTLTTGEWPPFTGSQLENQGLFTHSVSLVFDALGWQVEYQFLPWKRATYQVDNHKAFAVFPYRTTEERLKSYVFSDPIMASEGRIMYLRSRFPDGVQWQEYQDLAKYTLGGTAGYWYEQPFKDAGLQPDISSSEIQTLKKLMLKRIDIIAIEKHVGMAMVAEHFPDQMADIAFADKPLDQSLLRLMVAKDYPQAELFLEGFNNTLHQLKEEGVIEAITPIDE